MRYPKLCRAFPPMLGCRILRGHVRLKSLTDPLHACKSWLVSVVGVANYLIVYSYIVLVSDVIFSVFGLELFMSCWAPLHTFLNHNEHLVKKVWRINRSSNRLLIVSFTSFDGFSLANHGWFTKFAIATFPLYGIWRTISVAYWDVMHIDRDSSLATGQYWVYIVHNTCDYK